MVDEIFTVTDRATKMVVLIPCGSRWNAAEETDNFWWELVRYHDLPRSIIGDRGPDCVGVLGGAGEVFGLRCEEVITVSPTG